MKLSIFLADEAATMNFGQQLATCLEAPMVIGLEGNLGAGKTTLVRALLQKLGYKDAVKSPTYTLVEEYVFPNFDLFHFDLYRLKEINELLDIGFNDYLKNNSICLIEWPALALQLVPMDLMLHFDLAESGRKLQLSTSNNQLEQKIKKCIY